MLKAKDIIDIYIRFFEKHKHKQIANSPLIPENDPTTLFTSSGMQPLIPYLLGETHPQGKRLVDVQNSFRAVDIDEVGDNRHTTFFRMLGNWSLGDYFKKEEIPWLWEFLTEELKLPKEKLFITVFKGNDLVPFDREAFDLWNDVLAKSFGSPQDFRISQGGVSLNWWSRSGVPDKMPIGEIGGPDTEVYYRFDDLEHAKECKDNPVECECGKFLEIANSVFIQYQKTKEGFKELSQRNVDFGGGVERLLAAVEDKSDIFETSLFMPIINTIEKVVKKPYLENKESYRIAADHMRAAIYLIHEGVIPANKDRGYILRRLIRRSVDSLQKINILSLEEIIKAIVTESAKTDPKLSLNFETIKNTILEEFQRYQKAVSQASKFLEKKYGFAGSPKYQKVGDELLGQVEINADDAFNLYTSYGLSPTQIKSLGYIFNDQAFAQKMKEHKNLSKTSSGGMFRGGLADHSELTVMGHTATHLLHKALRDMFGESLHQTGSNITNERLRFDFNFDRKLEDFEISTIEETVNAKINDNLPVHFEIMPLAKAKELGAIGLFDEKYANDVKVYFVDDYSVEFCGGPHVDFTGAIKKFKIIKQENLGKRQRRIYGKVNTQI